MKAMMERSGNAHLLTVLSYPDTGHLIDLPYGNHCRASNFMTASSREKCTYTHTRERERENVLCSESQYILKYLN